MNHISDDELFQHISDAVTQVTPDNAEELWNKPVTLADGSEWYLDTSNKYHNKKKKKFYLTGTLAACLLLCFVSTFMYRTMPSASIYLDINPSILLKVNYKNRVTDLKACNEDAEKIINGLDLKGTDLDVALYALLGSLVHNNYLTEAKDTVLVSVQSANPNRASELETFVSDIITADLEDMIQSSEVLTSQLDDNMDSDDDEEDATPGKDAFIEDLIRKYPELQSYPLDDMTMDEIISLLNEKGLDYSKYKENDDDEDDFDEDDLDEDDLDEDDFDDDDFDDDDLDEDD